MADQYSDLTSFLLAEWTLHYQKDDADGVPKVSTYDAIMSNFQYFAAIRNMGQV